MVEGRHDPEHDQTDPHGVVHARLARGPREGVKLSEETSLLPKDVGPVAESLRESLHHLLQLPVPQEDVSQEEKTCRQWWLSC